MKFIYKSNAAVWQAASTSQWQRQRRQLYYRKLLKVVVAILEGMSKSIDGFYLGLITLRAEAVDGDVSLD